ncbi:arginine ABC transporter ATP-binding protein [Bifidobacterium margollesii]|uniref:Arginine ABC transporter ATP-binding protein n=1 Tax=Bifidobacterium margollesii TaxID=2020964 RepID=A0A2N5JBZ8_9BIFI|nr:amino acid ABC transporter ATP-binding protein [Bifidobacterium margollesii]PLS31701.1 arginine ABC transporter ATP-binding protein [Bifidobacterium margollesii]
MTEHTESHDEGIVVSLRGIRKSFGSNEILKGIDLDVPKGEVLAILGSSGSGKTTLLRCINALERPDSGSVRVDGSFIDYDGKVSNKDILALRRKTAMVFQNYNLFKNKTALQNITEGLTVVQKMPKDKAVAVAREVLEKVGLAEYADRYPVQLSGGQQQRVSIARALALDPDVILFDEPTSALDPELVSDVNDTIVEVAKTGVTMIIVTHEIRFAHNVASRVIFVDKGTILEEGTPEEVIDHPKTERVREFLSKMAMK